MPRLTDNIKTFILILLVACSCNNKNRQPASSIKKDQQEALCIPRTKYDSVYCSALHQMDSFFRVNRPKEGIDSIRKTYTSLEGSDSLQKKFLTYIYDHRQSIEKDSQAAYTFYDLFTEVYPDKFFKQVYDPAYADVAEYFIRLQKEKNLANPDYIITFKNQLGISYNIAGDLKKATAYYREVYDYDLRDVSNGNVGGSVQNICIALNEWNKEDSALRLIEKTLKLNLTSNSDLAAIYLLQSEAFLEIKNITAAIAAAGKAEIYLPKIRYESEDTARNFARLAERSADLLRLRARIANVQQHTAQFLLYARKTLNATLQMTGTYRVRNAGKALLQLGSAFKQNNQPDSAIWFFHQALYTVAQVDSSNIHSLPEEKYVYPENTMMDALDSLAKMWDEQYVQTKQFSFLKKALQARKLAFIAERKLLEAFSYDESMKSQLLSSKKRSEYALNNCWLLWQNDHAPQWIEQAILMNENSKAVALLHSLKKNSVLNNLQEQDTVALSLKRNRFQTIALEQELNTVTDQKRKKEIQNTLTKLNEDGLLLETGLKSRLPGFKRTGLDTSLLSLSAIQKSLLDKQTCLLQYFRADSGAFVVWLDGRQHLGMKWLPENSLRIIDSFTAGCRSAHGLYEKDQPAFIRLAKTCTDIALPDNIQQQIKNGQYKKLLIIPDGGFSMLPFDALTPAGDQFLVRFSTVYTGYSISTLLANDATNTKAKGIAVFAPFTKSAIGMLQRLEFSQDEAKAVDAANKQADLYTDTAARIERFRRSFETKAILHMATHATGNDSIQRIYFSDDSLDVRELYAAHTYAELVVLNGCETGVGRLDPNEGPLSLARGFYYAGARNVINSLWQIDDLASAGMFGNFYNNYSNGHTGAALRNAKLNYLNTNSGRLQAPYYWAGLVHTGIDTEKPVSKKSWWWIFPAALAIIASLILAPVIYKRRRR